MTRAGLPVISGIWDVATPARAPFPGMDFDSDVMKSLRQLLADGRLTKKWEAARQQKSAPNGTDNLATCFRFFGCSSGLAETFGSSVERI
jgi:hypothetical protein